METAGFLPSPCQLLSIFADGLPCSTVAFINLYDNIISWLNKPNKQLLPSIHFLFDHTVNIENNIQCNHIMNPSPCHPVPGMTPTPVQPVQPVPAASLPITPANACGARPPLCCSNCGCDGHMDDTCFQPGGAMEGWRDEYLANRIPKPITHIAEVDDSQLDSEEGIVEDTTLTTEFAAMTINTLNDIHFSTYALSSFSEIMTEQPFVLSSISQEYNSALDSACMNHIFHDCNLFHTYDIDGSMSVKTANCGFLATLAIGDVKIRLTIGDKTIIWTLWNCLHAPTVPINLVSVSALQEHHMTVAFSFQKTTISFPPDHPHLSGLSFDAHITCCLSLLSLDFILPSIPPVTLHLFPVTPVTPDLWHCCFGHLVYKASKNIINGKYLTGIIKPPTPIWCSLNVYHVLLASPHRHLTWITLNALSCLQSPHVDTCSPFPTLTPKKEAYFTIFLDNKSN